jgi:hypothetical protein
MSEKWKAFVFIGDFVLYFAHFIALLFAIDCTFRSDYQRATLALAFCIYYRVGAEPTARRLLDLPQKVGAVSAKEGK